jgi:hypothetical protein
LASSLHSKLRRDIFLNRLQLIVARSNIRGLAPFLLVQQTVLTYGFLHNTCTNSSSGRRG